MATNRTYLLRKPYVKHLLLAVIITVILLFTIGGLLRFYTHHGDVVTVPDLTGLTPEQVMDKKMSEEIDIVVVDSVYDVNKQKGSIAFQDPPPGSVVKRHRTVYLTLVAMLPEQVRMPNLTDLTLRQASAVLETYGLMAGKLDYIPDIAKNAVLKQRYKGKPIEPGTLIEKGERIDLVLGQGVGNGSIHLPFLLGMKRQEAIEAIENAFFVVGSEVYEDGKDEVNARVFKQSPSPSSSGRHKPGDTISLVYRSVKKFDFDSYIKQYKLDSLRETMNDSL
ncbi:MAG: PASTA domain-containing protein [Bacteroidetes bacterium]|nr:PASTA domain-containing protein [Bacteroidota bacterium]